MTNAASRPSALIRFTQVSNDLLDSRYLRHIKNIVFVLVLLNYWSKLYNTVLIGGPVRAIHDFKTYLMRVNIVF
jgi:sphinganine-1-phosphate aldolase